MKNRYFIYLSYDGTTYHGWQCQPNSHSVQEEIERALFTILRIETGIVGAGRTDTGVSARLMVAHFDVDIELDCEYVTHKLNRVLPRDIAVDKLEKVASGMHARFSAKWRTYHYYVHTKRDPFVRHYSLELYRKINFELMNEAAILLLDNDDFGAFCKSNSDAKTMLCDVTEARWYKSDDTHWYFRITANRFLRNMVRAIVGTLLEVGRGKLSVEDFRQVILSGTRTRAGESVLGTALFLENIEY